MKEISQTAAAKALGVKSLRHQAQCINNILKGYGYKPANRVPVEHGFKYTYFGPQVKEVAEKEAVKAAEARKAGVAAAVAKAAEPKTPPAQLQDDDVIAIKKAVEGQSSYICRLGERTERAERAIAQVEATQRVILIAINRLLKAANLPTVTQVHGPNGGAHTAPEAQQ